MTLEEARIRIKALIRTCDIGISAGLEYAEEFKKDREALELLLECAKKEIQE